jgi:hypothetical protein
VTARRASASGTIVRGASACVAWRAESLSAPENRFVILTVELRDEGGRDDEEARRFRTANPFFFQLLDANRAAYTTVDATFRLDGTDPEPCTGQTVPANGRVRCRLAVEVPASVTSGTLEYEDYERPLATAPWALPRGRCNEAGDDTGDHQARAGPELDERRRLRPRRPAGDFGG